MSTAPEAEEERPGLLTFAAMLMFAVCFVRIISAINYFGHGIQVANLTGTVFGNRIWVWGIWDLALALLALIAGTSLLVGASFGRVFGYIWAIWAIVQSFLIIDAEPWFAASTIAIAAVVIYGLATTSGWREEGWG
jgi:hypothetical protein